MKTQDGGVVEGDVILVTDLPEGYAFGCDTMAHVGFGDPCCGIRGIPPGVHFVWASPKTRRHPRSGCWVISSRGKQNIYVLQWNQYTQKLGHHASSYEKRVYRESIGEHTIPLFQYSCPVPGSDQLGPRTTPCIPDAYIEPATVWSRITNYITPALLHRVTGRSDGDWSIHSDHRVQDISETRGATGLRRMSFTMCGGDLSLTFARLAQEARLKHERKAVKARKTKIRINGHIAHLVSSLGEQPGVGPTDSDLAGEFQFLFIAGALANNDDCLEL